MWPVMTSLIGCALFSPAGTNFGDTSILVVEMRQGNPSAAREKGFHYEL